MLHCQALVHHARTVHRASTLPGPCARTAPSGCAADNGVMLHLFEPANAQPVCVPSEYHRLLARDYGDLCPVQSSNSTAL
jgi:hypothetical protein